MSALKPSLAKTVYKVEGAALTVVGVAALSYHLGKRSGQTAGYEIWYFSMFILFFK